MINQYQYAIAEENGISRELVRERVYLYGWSVRRAINEPKHNRKKNEWLDVALANGISKNTFHARRANGMTDEEAATKPVKKRLPSKYREMAIKNGISLSIFYKRIKKGEDPESAATRPHIDKRFKGGKM